jgi:putative serine protease PepD
MGGARGRVGRRRLHYRVGELVGHQHRLRHLRRYFEWFHSQRMRGYSGRERGHPLRGHDCRARANGSGTGSGEVIRSDGYILTNNHVISIAAASGGSVEVQFSDGQVESATITGRDPQTDLAVLKVETSRQLKVIALGSSSSVQVGEPVVAIGAPLGLSGTVTSGIVSALNRTVQVPGDNDSTALLVSAVQTDASINPGNSGGALVDCAGKLVGVPTAGATVPSPSGESGGGSIGLGFAIPVDLASPSLTRSSPPAG